MSLPLEGHSAYETQTYEKRSALTFEEYMKLDRAGKMKARINDLALVASSQVSVGDTLVRENWRQENFTSENRKDSILRPPQNFQQINSLIIYPTLELHNGKCVSLIRGRLDEPVIWHVDPVETARSFAATGAEWIHITDVNALSGDGNNNGLLEQIIRTAGVPIQLGGGFRSPDAVEAWIDKGVGRIVIGTMAAHDPALLIALAKRYPDQIVLSVDVSDGSVMTEGWRTKSAFLPESFIAAFDDIPLAYVIVTDIDSAIEDSDSSLTVIASLAACTRHPVIARGTVRSVDDVKRLKYVPNLAGTLIGRAIMTKDVDLAEALAAAKSMQEPVAAFQ
jgi:phosphoribosylformimino-5-aminoimidazole carboxamide ribotide isomerase